MTMSVIRTPPPSPMGWWSLGATQGLSTERVTTPCQLGQVTPMAGVLPAPPTAIGVGTSHYIRRLAYATDSILHCPFLEIPGTHLQLSGLVWWDSNTQPLEW